MPNSTTRENQHQQKFFFSSINDDLPHNQRKTPRVSISQHALWLEFLGPKLPRPRRQLLDFPMLIALKGQMNQNFDNFYFEKNQLDILWSFSSTGTSIPKIFEIKTCYFLSISKLYGLYVFCCRRTSNIKIFFRPGDHDHT